MSSKDHGLSVGRKTPVFFVAALAALVVACMFIVGCAGSNGASSDGANSNAAAPNAGIDAVEFVTNYKSELTDEDIDDLLNVTNSAAGEILGMERGYGNATEESVSKELTKMDKAFSAVAKKYDVSIAGDISEEDVSIIQQMLANAYMNTEKYNNAVEELKEYSNAQK